MSNVNSAKGDKSGQEYTLLSQYHRLAGPEGTWFEIPITKWREFQNACKNLDPRAVIKKFARFQVH